MNLGNIIGRFLGKADEPKEEVKNPSPLNESEIAACSIDPTDKQILESFHLKDFSAVVQDGGKLHSVKAREVKFTDDKMLNLQISEGTRMAWIVRDLGKYGEPESVDRIPENVWQAMERWYACAVNAVVPEAKLPTCSFPQRKSE